MVVQKQIEQLEPRTPGECLWCRRQKAGMRVADAAKALGLSRGGLWRAETDQGPCPMWLGPLARAKPGLPEFLALARRRSGLGLGGVATALGVSRPTVHKMEREGNEKIIAFWLEKMG
jgi:predicted transcriptional regulator